MAFDHGAAWCMTSTILQGQIMELIMELGMSMQTSHGLLVLFAV